MAITRAHQHLVFTLETFDRVLQFIIFHHATGQAVFSRFLGKVFCLSVTAGTQQYPHCPAGQDNGAQQNRDNRGKLLHKWTHNYSATLVSVDDDSFKTLGPSHIPFKPHIQYQVDPVNHIINRINGILTESFFFSLLANSKCMLSLILKILFLYFQLIWTDYQAY